MVKLIKILFLFVISSAGLFYAFKNIEISELFHHLHYVDVFKFFLAISVLMFSNLIRARRLMYLANPIDKNISTHHLFGATMIGYFGNGILFFRLGEILKAYAISQGRRIKPSESFGLIMLERVIDAFSVFCLLIISLPLLPIDNLTVRYWIFGFALFTILLIGVLVLLKFFNWESFINNLNFLSKSLKINTVEVMKKIFKGLNLVFTTKHKVSIIRSTIMIWLCYFLMTKLLLESCNVELNLPDSFMMLIIGAIIISVPALPGGLGTYEAGITYALTFLFFVPKDLALTYAIVSHASNYLPYITVGSYYFIKSGLKINSIKDVTKNK